MRLADRAIAETPFLVVDVETTGLDASYDRVVEVSAVRVSPDGTARVVFDTLIRPERAMAATAIHGITEADVADAPRFSELADAVRALMAERVIVGHNAGFDLRFLRMEFERLGRTLEPPHVCTMRLPALFDRPARWPLWWACQRAGVPFDGQAHSARGDAVATAALWQVQRGRLGEAGVETFGALLARARRMRVTGRWLDALTRPTLPAVPLVTGARQVPLKPRARGEAGAAAVSPKRRYLDAVVRAVARLEVDADGREAVRAARIRLGIDDETARAVHARILAGARRRYAENGRIDPEEESNLEALAACLVALEPGGAGPPGG